MNPGDIKWCKLTRKKLIIQKVIEKFDEDPMLLIPAKKIEKVLVRYWSRVQDRFFTDTMYPEEIADTAPEYDKKFDKQLKEPQTETERKITFYPVKKP